MKVEGPQPPQQKKQFKFNTCFPPDFSGEDGGGVNLEGSRNEGCNQSTSHWGQFFVHQFFWWCKQPPSTWRNSRAKVRLAAFWAVSAAIPALHARNAGVLQQRRCCATAKWRKHR